MKEAGADRSVLILMGSARSDGDTAEAARQLAAGLSGMVTTVDLGLMRILPFDYAQPHQDDDFAAVVELILAHRTLIFATPVYWYAMSGPTKTFFDRLTDLLSPRDATRRGRSLAGREVWLLAVGTDPRLPEGFERPFEMTAAYLGMSWRGRYYVRSGKLADATAIAALTAALEGRPPDAG